jgi:hypoxanthine phosphoribosyltransferase
MAEVSDAPVWETWEHLFLKTTTLGNKIIRATLDDPSKRFDRLAFVPRGGLYVANILARMFAFDGTQLVSLGISKYHREVPGQEGKFKYGQLPRREDVEGHRFLLAEEVYDTGETTEESVSILEGLGALSVQTAAIHVKPAKIRTGKKPDYYVDETNGWVHYMWEALDPQGTVYQDALHNGNKPN